ncbi:hypothetical protein [uncultured Aquimarina sp.]|uniref:hypothetical protein n=1 Tax=uncultured Aquimarina sp. TaxID=575652 RepID=UPI0026318AF5|nr:hypothetical protein [uncultured Aquimarina sp.]
MEKSKSNLDNYIQHLMLDDQALEQFIKNPLASESNYGLTKAERAVMRRVVQHLPATSKSGFGLRTKISYRRSLRLLQNVLHNSASKMHTNVLRANSDVESSEVKNGVSSNGGVFHMYVYYPNGGSKDYTCKQNSDINADGGPYSNYRYFQIVFGSGYTTVSRLLLGASQAFPSNISYQTVLGGNQKPYVSEITIDGNAITADLSNSCYDLQSNPNADFAFWFYSINGLPNYGGTNGNEGMSFADYYLNDGDTVYWQLIAPDQQYGFQPC